MLRPVALALFASACLLAASRPADAANLEGVLSGYSLTSWHDDAGRPLGSVYAIAQDRDGYLWIGTDAGLLRFDGWRFTALERLAAGAVPDAPVRSVTLARDGTLWLGFGNRAGAGQLRDGQLVRRQKGLENLDAVAAIVEDGRGVMWAIGDRSLFTLHEDEWRRVRLPWKTREGQVQTLHVGRSGQLWVGTRWGVFEHIPGTNAFRLVSDEHVWGLVEDDAGQMWTSDIVAGFRRLGAPAPPGHALEGAGYRLAHDRTNLWVGTFGHGLWRVKRDGEPYAIERATLRTGLSSDSILSLIVDRHGNVWVGTTAGLHRLTRRSLTPLEDVGFVLAVHPLDGGRVLAGTTKGLVRLEPATDGWKRVRVGSATPDVRTLYRDGRGTVWVGTADGLWRFAGGRLTHVPLPSRDDMLVLSISPDRSGGLWLGDGEWLYHWDGATLEPLALPPAHADLARLTFVRADRSGRLWMGFDGKAIGRLEPDGTFRVLGPDEGFVPLPNQTLLAVYEDDEGAVWLGTSHGLSRFANHRVSSVHRAQGLPHDRVLAIVEDRQRHLWLSVDRGLIRIAKDGIAQAIANPSRRMQYQMFDPLDGVAGAPLGIIGSVREREGGLWFVRGGGVTYVDPRDLTDPPAELGPLRIDEVVANDRRLTPNGHASLPAGTRRLEISYTALAVASSDRIRFRHRLEGFDADWIEAGSRRTAFYTNLSPRDYRFLVEAQLEDGTRNATTAEWSFTIQPAIYQSTWFYALWAAAAVATVWLVWSFRLRLVRQRFALVLAERARLSREIHDTLLQSLVGVALQFDGIAQALDPSATAARQQLTRIRRQVEAYIRDARQSIWDLRSPVLETRDLATALREFAIRAIGDDVIRLTSSVSGAPMPLPPAVENQLLRIGQEAITNAVRHARPARLHLDLRFDRTSVALRVIDDGSGFDDGHLPGGDNRHYGLMTMRERAEELGGTLTIATAAGRGTSIEAVVPASEPATSDLPAAV